MATTGFLSHIDLSVGDPGRAIAFYDALLTAIGYRRWQVDQPDWSGPAPTRATWGIRHADGLRFEIEVRPAHTHLRHIRYDRFRPGPHHLAFHADTEADVDRAHRAIVDVGGDVLDRPANYGGQTGYGRYYYAVFFADPDGVKLEVCCTRPGSASGGHD